MAWVLVPCLVSLRAEFDAVSPSRDKGADGSIGDTAHTSASDHSPDEDSDVLRDHDADNSNEVHALDIDSTGPWPEPGWFDRSIRELVTREKAEFESTTVVGRLKYVIWNRRIAERANGWNWRAYTLPDPHTNHAHFSARYTTGQENDTRPWGIQEDDVALSADDRTWIKTLVEAQPVKVWKVAWSGEAAETRLANASSALRRVDELGAYVNHLAADELARDQADAERDAALPQQVVEALGAGQSPERVAAALKQIPGVDWAAVAPFLAQ